MAGVLFILPENAGVKRPRENDNSRTLIAKRVRRNYEPDHLTRRPRGSLIYPPVKNQKIVRGFQFYRGFGITNIPAKDPQRRVSSSSSTREFIPGRTFRVSSSSNSRGRFIPGRTFKVPLGSSGSSTENFIPNITFRIPLESSSSESRRSSLPLERISYGEIMQDIQRARQDLRDALSGKTPSRRLSNSDVPVRELTRKNLARHRRAERRRLAEERRNALSKPQRPVFREVNWNKGASQPYEDDNISPRMKASALGTVPTPNY
ncbi:hypothetical protein F4811DRAFT_573481 [Daldinia bambusicola]|nr:hypothetical protein F4811DRAFT_573481 [Daldinia bambusicola]